jgi:hypothetical protein
MIASVIARKDDIMHESRAARRVETLVAAIRNAEVLRMTPQSVAQLCSATAPGCTQTEIIDALAQAAAQPDCEERRAERLRALAGL